MKSGEAIATGLKQARAHFANLENKKIRMSNLKRFLEAQAGDYVTALREISRGRKRSHWMWYIFPQLGGLGYSEMATRYAIRDLPEAAECLSHPVLGPRLVEISKALIMLPGNNPATVMGSPDDLKLRSSMTLFALVPRADPVFEEVLRKYFSGEKTKQPKIWYNRPRFSMSLQENNRQTSGTSYPGFPFRSRVQFFTSGYPAPSGTLGSGTF